MKMRAMLFVVLVAVLCAPPLFADVGEGVYGGGQILEDKGDELFKVSFGGYAVEVDEGVYEGEWEVNFHDVSGDALDQTKFHSNQVVLMNFYEGNSATCDHAMNMTLLGSWQGMPGFKMIFRAGDFGPPGGWTDSAFDTIRFELWDDNNDKVYDSHWKSEFTDESSCQGPARTGLDRGNVTIEMF